MIGILVLLVAPVLYGVMWLRRGHRRSSVALAVAGWSAGVAAVLALLLVQALFADEGELPPDDLAGRLPAGLVVVAQDRQCGSGGCWREYTVRDGSGSAADADADAVAGRLRATGLEGCRRSVWIPDLRRRCTDVSTRGGSVVVAVDLEGP